jgi:hypothetical protein
MDSNVRFLLNALIRVDDIALSVWEPSTTKNLKIEQVLSLKTAQERPLLKEFANEYATIMRDIHADEVRLTKLGESLQRQQFGGDDVSKVLVTQKEVLAKEIELSSRVFEDILNDIIGIEQGDSICELPKGFMLILDARVVCWLRMLSIILNPPSAIKKLEFFDSFAKKGRLKAQDFISQYIASKTASLAKQLLSSRSWAGNIPEQSLWEGTLRRGRC